MMVMRNLLITVVSICLVGVCLQGCVTEQGYYDRQTGAVYLQDEYEALPQAAQDRVEIVEVETISPEVSEGVDRGIATADTVVKVVRPFIPEPFATGAVALLGGLGSLWQTIKKKKMKDTLDKVSLGAKITADSVDAVVRPASEVWQEFKKRQLAESSNTPAIMPNLL